MSSNIAASPYYIIRRAKLTVFIHLGYCNTCLLTFILYMTVFLSRQLKGWQGEVKTIPRRGEEQESVMVV